MTQQQRPFKAIKTKPLYYAPATNAAIQSAVRPTVCMSRADSSKTVGSPMLEIKLTGWHHQMANKSGQNVLEAKKIT